MSPDTSLTIDITTFPPPRSIADLVRFERIGLFGATDAAREVEALLKDHGRAVSAYFDNDARKHGTKFRGLEVGPATRAVEFARQGGAIVIVAAYQVEIATQLKELGVDRSRVFPFVSRMFAPHFGRDAIAPAVDKLGALLRRVADEPSRSYIRDLVRFRWTMDPMELRKNPRVLGMYQYDDASLGPKPGAHVVDCGAYTGDTAELFLNRLGGNARVTAIEPLARNHEALTAWIERAGVADKVRPVRAAVGAEVGTVTIDAGEDPADPRASVGSGAEQVPAESLDHLFAGREGDVGFIKVDIEGFEIEAMRGAARVLRHKPDLAIAGYHRPAHLWEIPEALDRLQPGYAIFVGHHPNAPYECEFFCTAKA